MNKKILVIVVVVIVAVAALGVFFVFGRPGRMFFGRGFPMGNFTMGEENITRVTGIFENAGTHEEITNYCNENRFECMYYCRNIDPGHEFCAGLVNFRDFGGVQR
jgi:flagellar basal body-associated protein FliL